ncbi:unnamed protein product, partial [Tenebrio molitor]
NLSNLPHSVTGHHQTLVSSCQTQKRTLSLHHSRDRLLGPQRCGTTLQQTLVQTIPPHQRTPLGTLHPQQLVRHPPSSFSSHLADQMVTNSHQFSPRPRPNPHLRAPLRHPDLEHVRVGLRERIFRLPL